MERESAKEMESESAKEKERESEHQAELISLHEEIMSLASERRNLLANLTPNLFAWETGSPTGGRLLQQEVQEEESVPRLRIVGNVQKMNSGLTEPAAVSQGRPNWQQEEFENYFDSILQDMEDLGYRMLSLADISSHAPISSYKKAEIFATTSRLMGISEGMSNNTNVDELVAQVDVRGGVVLARCETHLEEALRAEQNIAFPNKFLHHCNNYLECPTDYKKHLALIITEEKGVEKEMDKKEKKEEEKKEEEKKKEKEKEEKKKEAKAKWMEKEAKANGMQKKGMEKEAKANGMENKGMENKGMEKKGIEKKGKELEEQEKAKAKGKGKELEEQGKELAKTKGKGKAKTKGKGKQKKEEDYGGVFGEETESKEYLKKRMVIEKEFFNNYRVGWEHTWGSKIGRFGSFHDTTTLSPMHFTNSRPGIIPHGSFVGTTLQIYSFEIKLNPDVNWPLRVYGVVAARDIVDRNRNLLFCRSRVNYQVLTADDPFLRLTGPDRAIVAVYPVDFEVELKIVDPCGSQDRALISLNLRYSGQHNRAIFNSSLCKGLLLLEPIHNAVQATIVGVQLAKGCCAFKYGCRVYCSLPGAGPASKLVWLLNSRGEENTIGEDGYLSLPRNVISVELEGELKVVIEAYTESAGMSAQGHANFYPKHCNIQQHQCYVGDCQVEITVAWSDLVQDKTDLLTEGFAALA